MKMVASSKLHRAQQAIGNMRPYEKHLFEIMSGFLSKLEDDIETRYSETREVRKVAIVAISSNSSLCGAFNTNVIKELKNTAAEYRAKGCEVEIYPIGRKVADAVKKLGLTPMGDYQHMSGKPNYKEASDLASELMERFLNDEIQQVEMLYNHFKSTSTQILTRETYLPINFSQASATDEEDKGKQVDYIVEPSAEKVMQELLPKVLRMKMYTALLDSNAAEHAARTMAMQIATDNANELIQDLTLIYNKSRQQAITNELLDIIGGTMA